MFCRDLVLTCSLAVLVGCSAVGGPPVNVDTGGAPAAGGSAAEGGSGGSENPQAGTTSIIPLDVGGATSSASNAGGAGGDTAGAPPSDNDNCGSQTENTKHQLVDILLVLDRSSSMLLSIAQDCYCDQATARAAGRGTNVCTNTTGCTNRWTSVTSGIASAVSSTPFLQWGLKFYSTPGNDVCGVSNQVEVGIPNGTADIIRDMLTNTAPANHTPTAAGIIAATNYLKGLTDGNPRVILLATDGEPNCAANSKDTFASDIKGTTAAIEAAFQAGIKTYVIGIGPSTGNLDNFAAAGRTNKHYPATTPQALNDALNAIGTAVVSCSFTLGDTPDDTDMNNVAVYVNKNLLPRDDPNGWSFGSDGKTIELNGAACETIKTQVSSAVQVLFGCKVPPKWIP